MTAHGSAPATPPASAPAGNIYDLGYRRYDGPRLARPFVGLGLLRQSFREAYGIGRGGRAKIAPFLLLGLTAFPAVIAVAVRAFLAQAGGAEAFEDQVPIRHDTYESVTLLFVMLFVAAQAPELFGRDQRYGVLPLFFSRALTRTDYALARTFGLFLALLLLTLVPHALLSIGAILAAADPITGLGKDLPEVPKYVAVSVLESGVLAAVAAVIASHVPRRAYSVAAIIALLIVSPIVVAIVAALSVPDAARVLLLVSPGDVIDGVNVAIFGPITVGDASFGATALPGWVYLVTALAFIGGGLAIVGRRYLTITV